MIELVAAAVALAQVDMRGLEPAPDGEIIGANASGVVLGVPGADGSGGKPTLVIGWDRVRAIRGPFDRAAEQWLKPSGPAERAWRARTRLERGDAIAAGPMFETLFQEFRATPGPTAAVIAEGLLRCRLRIGAHVAAIEPWLALLDSTGEGPPRHRPDWASDAGLAPIVDGTTGLVPALPPIFAGASASQVMAGLSLPSLRLDGGADGASAAGALAALYVAAAAFEAGETVAAPDALSNDPGVQLVRLIVVARVGDPGQRDAARRTLETRLPAPGAPAQDSARAVAPWVEAWSRAAIGRSLLREDDAEHKRLGIVELLHLPARFSETHPYLAGLALAEASVALRGLGDDTGADALLKDLMARHPDHPVLLWEPIRSRAGRPLAAAPSPQSSPAVPRADRDK